MKTEEMSVDKLIPYERNAKIHDDRQVANVARSIEEFGMVQPIVIDGENNIIIGHCRAQACKKVGLKTVPVVKLDDLTPEEANRLRFLDNKLNESEWDMEMLKLDDLSEIDFEGFDLDFDFGSISDDWEPVSGDELPEEDLFDDIEKMEKHYGVPYQGNKSRIADIIISLLPEGKRLVDLFGGGGAITHCAMLSGKWDSFLYNDLNKMITDLFMDAIHGKYHEERRVITREDFNELKDSDPYVKYIWSFGNNGTGYLWGAEIEEIKCQACRALMADEVNERRLEYVKFVKMLKENECATLNRLQSVEHLQALTQLEALQRLEASNIDYRNYKHKDGDVVYCDVPYEQIGKGRCDDYGAVFDSFEFYEWAKAQPYQIFFSSYEISDDSFDKVKVKSVASLIGANTNGQKVNEYLYSNQQIKR